MGAIPGPNPARRSQLSKLLREVHLQESPPGFFYVYASASAGMTVPMIRKSMFKERRVLKE